MKEKASVAIPALVVAALLVFSVALVGVWALWTSEVVVVGRSTFSKGTDSERVTVVYYPGKAGEPELPEWEYRETRSPNGEWVRNGPATRWSRSGQALEFKFYVNGVQIE